MRVGFLFNHYAVHQVPHAAPYAFELSRLFPEIEVIVACATRKELAMVREIAQLYPGHRCRYVRVRPSWFYLPTDPFVSRKKFKRKNIVLRDNLDFFRSLDALVAPERHCFKLRSQYGLTELKLIHTRHGAGDREGGFDDRSHAFDFTLLPGRKYVERLSELGHLPPEKYAVAGWPKFEVVRGLQRGRRRFFDNDNPVVVYNPHFDQDVSSWAKMGLQVLDWFAANPRYNLIFAPHVVLFKRSQRHNAFLPRKYQRIANILVDTDSVNLSDMTYMLAADVYLGDVSSQVYEFLLEPRPCVFLNAHHVEWRGNVHYLHWTLGQVVGDVPAELGPALERAPALQEQFRPRQEEAFAYTFHSEPGSTAAERGARAIARFLTGARAPGESAAPDPRRQAPRV